MTDLPDLVAPIAETDARESPTRQLVHAHVALTSAADVVDGLRRDISVELQRRGMQQEDDEGVDWQAKVPHVGTATLKHTGGTLMLDPLYGHPKEAIASWVDDHLGGVAPWIWRERTVEIVDTVRLHELLVDYDAGIVHNAKTTAPCPIAEQLRASSVLRVDLQQMTTDLRLRPADVASPAASARALLPDGSVMPGVVFSARRATGVQVRRDRVLAQHYTDRWTAALLPERAAEMLTPGGNTP